MIVRKLFKFEFSHIVRNCYTDRCKYNIHGHSGLAEIFLKSKTLDNGGMTVDFNVIKQLYNDFIDSFDHTYIYWSKENQEYKDFIQKYSERWIELPITPSAEAFSVLFLYVLDKIIKNTQFANGEKNVQAHAVRFHETTTGYAEAQIEDLEMINYDLNQIIFSDGVIKDWKNQDWVNQLQNNIPFILKETEQQIR